MIEDLPPLTSDASRSARTIARCHNQLASRRRKIEARHRRPTPSALGTEGVLVAGLCFAYLLAMAGNVLSIVGGL